MELERVELGRIGTPSDVLRMLRGDERPFLLVGDWAGGGAIAGAAPVSRAPGPDPFGPDPFGPLREGMDAHSLGSPAGETDPRAFSPVGGGWFGYLGFALGAAVERLPPGPPRPHPLPEADLAYHDHVLRMRPDGVWWFEALVSEERRAAVRARLEDLQTRRGEPRPWRLHGMAPRPPGHDGHRWAVADTVRRIAEGELYQANVCLRLDGELDGDPLDAFADAVAVLRPSHGAFFGVGEGRALLSFSPELFLRRAGRTAWTAPIKGTAPRPPGDEAAAERGRLALAASAKDAAEHVMIVDLMRNDLGRVARYGTVTAAARPHVEPHPGLWHLVSPVRAELREDVEDAELVRAAFPPGSVTGAPKVQALHVIAALEATAREAYTGAIGFVSPVAGLHLSVAIRTFEVSGRHVWLGAGGGVVADSDPDAELREALGKARPLVETLGGTVAEPGPWRRRPVPPLHDHSRPDPALGVLETIRVADGRPEHLDRHFRRLAEAFPMVAAAAGTTGPRRSRAGRGPDLLAIRTAAEAAAAESGPGLHRLRVVVRPGGDVLIEVLPSPEVPEPVELVPVCVPGGLGCHKWADRRPLGVWRAPQLGLIVDSDGAVLEAATANVWIVEGGQMLTPPADGRLLAGIARERILQAGGVCGFEAAVEGFDLPRLRRADAVLLTSSVALVTPAGPGASALAAAARAELSAACAPSATAAPGAGPGSSRAPGRSRCW